MALAPEQQAQYDSLIGAGASESAAMAAAQLVPVKSSSKTTNGADNSDFISTLQNKLLGQAGAISSEDTKIEKTIQSAISGVQKSAESSALAIESKYDREKGYTAEAGQERLTSFMEAGRGFATNTAALRQINEETDKSLKDLEQRKQELILQGNSAAAGQVATLELQALEFRQKAQQTAFTNLLGIANFGLSVQAQKDQTTQFERKMQFDESSAMSNIALQYGLDVKPGETLTSMYSRATKDMGANSPAALAMKSALSTINRNNAEIAKIQADAAASKSLNATDQETLARAIAARPDATGALLANIKDGTTQSNILLRSEEIKFNDAAVSDKSDGTSKSDSKNAVLSRQDLSASQKAIAIKQIESVYGADAAQPQGKEVYGLPQTAWGGYKGYANTVDSALSWIFGVQSNPPFTE